MGGTSPLDYDRAAAEMSRRLGELERLARDGVVVAVGLGLLGFQRAQVRRVEVTRQLRDLAAGARDQLADLAQMAEGADTLRAGSESSRAGSEALRAGSEALRAGSEALRAGSAALRTALEDLDQRIDRLEEQLPAGARSVVRSLREAAAGSEQAIRSAFGGP